jgi:UDP-N-acetylmuramoyl-tripeptide--D-alanyl-D-alanine ligase
MKLSQLAKWLNISCDEDVDISGVCIDTRQLSPQQLFVAFPGEQVDGHDYVNTAIEKGASAVMVNRQLAEVNVPQLVVNDSLQALTTLAQCYRAQLKCKVMALTGSNGKTSVKEMLAHILPQPAFASRGNFNNHLGVPINLLNVPIDCEYAVFELGANQKGDIALTAGLVQPDVALINNIGPAHLGGFGSIDGVAIAKGEIYDALQTAGFAIVNDDDAYAHFWDEQLLDVQVLRYSSEHTADVWASDIILLPSGCYRFQLHILGQTQLVELRVPGRHQMQNALAAAAMAAALSIPLTQIAQGLMHFSGVAGRLRIMVGEHDATVIDDTYNANLASVQAGLEVLAKREGEKILVIGDLAELGEFAEAQHAQIGEIARKLGINKLFAVGQSTPFCVAAFGEGGCHFTSQEELVAHLRKCLHRQLNILVKGSRSSRMEEVVKQISGLSI